MGKIGKGTKCSVNDCEGEAVRSIDIGKVKEAGLDAKGAKRAYLCKAHYKDYKKGSKKSSQIERWRHSA